jgi:repressor LexA
MNYFWKEDNKVVIEAANAKYPTIRPRQELKIGGIVTASMRKYHS